MPSMAHPVQHKGTESTLCTEPHLVGFLRLQQLRHDCIRLCRRLAQLLLAASAAAAASAGALRPARPCRCLLLGQAPGALAVCNAQAALNVPGPAVGRDGWEGSALVNRMSACPSGQGRQCQATRVAAQEERRQLLPN